MAGFSPLHYAAWYSRERIAQFLLSFDIDPNQSGTVRDRALHIGKQDIFYNFFIFFNILFFIYFFQFL